MILKPILLIGISLIASLTNTAIASTAGNVFNIPSPNGDIRIDVKVEDGVNYRVYFHNKEIVSWSKLDLVLQDKPRLRHSSTIEAVSYDEVSKTLLPEVRVKSAEIIDNYREMEIEFANGYDIVFRAYDNGVAYHFQTNFLSEIVVVDEIAEFNFSNNAEVYYPEEESFYSHNERSYLLKNISKISSDTLGSTPALVDTGKGKVLVTETALRDYSGMWLVGNGNNGLAGTFPRVPTKVVKGDAPWEDRNQPVVARADYIAKTDGTRDFPWRILAVAKDDIELISNQLTYQLAIPNKIGDTSWIKPGKVAWDWYNANNIHGVDFKAGLNTETYKYYIDFAAEFGVEYVILDEGWYPLGNIMGSVPGFDVPAIMEHAQRKGVKIILWVTWLTLQEQFDEAMDRFADLGAVGIKPDFFQRDDQEMVNFYWKIAKEAAKRKLLVDFHGAYKPAGLRRTYPNVITREGVKGLEWNKWSYDSTPEHNTTLPFIRMVAGPMDYTPGAMSNAVGPAAYERINYSGKDSNHADFAIRFARPMSQTTRVHQMAMFTVFESPLQMMADTPSQYKKENECASFIAKVPSVWDETVPLKGQIGDYIAVARRSGSDWFIGTLNDENERSLELDLSFLPVGKFKMEIFKDGKNATHWAEDYSTETKVVDKSSKLKIKLAPGGGYTAHLTLM